MSLIPEISMPQLRIELRWEKTAHQKYICHYNLVLPLRESDIRREQGDGLPDLEVLTIEMGTTERDGPPPLRDSEIESPFRNGVHAQWDSRHLGNLPIYAVCGGMAYYVENKT